MKRVAGGNAHVTEDNRVKVDLLVDTTHTAATRAMEEADAATLAALAEDNDFSDLPTPHEAMVRSLKRTREMYLSNYGQRTEIHHEW